MSYVFQVLGRDRSLCYLGSNNRTAIVSMFSMTRSNSAQGLDSDAFKLRKGCIFDATYDNQDERIAESERLFSDRDEVEVWSVNPSDTSAPDEKPKKLHRGYFSCVSHSFQHNTTLRRCLLQDALNDDQPLRV